MGTNTAVTGAGPWNWTCLGLNTGASPTCTAFLSTSTASCSPPDGFTCNQSPYTYENVVGPNTTLQLDINTWLTYKFRAPAGKVNVHPIKFDASFYTGTQAALFTAVTSTNLGLRDYVISLTPGSMTAVSPYCRKLNQGLAATIYISLNAEFGTCALAKGVQYYLNVKASGTTTSTVAVDYLLKATSME